MLLVFALKFNSAISMEDLSELSISHRASCFPYKRPAAVAPTDTLKDR